MQYLGINLAGAEFGSLGQSYGTGYTYPTSAEIDYYAAKGLNTIRIPFLWERLQPTLNGALDQDELKRLDAVVNYAAAKGITVDLDVHNYGTYYGAQVGGSAVPNSAYADLWGKIAGHYASNPKVLFGLMNEPQQSSAAAWLGSQNAAIGAIRAAGATQEILVSGVGWDGAWTWTGSGTQNAAVIGTGVVDPLHNYAFEVHQYLDSDGSGTHGTVVSADIGVSRLTAITQWAEATGSKLFLGEFGVAGDATSLKAMGNMLAYMNQHTGAWQGATYWAGGPWWGEYIYSAEPTNGVDAPQMGVLQQGAAPSVAITAQALKRDTGVSATDNITSNGAVTLSGTASGAAGTVVRVLDGTTVLGAATLASNGTWSYGTTLAAGVHALRAATVDGSGNITASASAAAITVLTAAPALAVTSETISADGKTATIAGSVVGPAGTTVSVSAGSTALGVATLDGKGGWSLAADLAPGDYKIRAVATDLAGNTASVTPSLTVPTPSGSGAPDTLVLSLSEDAYKGDAQFTVSVDGKQIGGTRTVTALHKLGQSQDVTLAGNFGVGRHTIGITFLNDAYGGSADTDRNLYVNAITLDGVRTAENSTLWCQGLATYVASIAPATPVLATSAPATSAPTTPAPAASLDTLVLTLSEDAYAGDAQFTVKVDGRQIGGTQTVTALDKLGQSEDFTLAGHFGAGDHTVSVNFMNDAYGGSADTDRNLHVKAITLNGTATTVNNSQYEQSIVDYKVSTQNASSPTSALGIKAGTLILDADASAGAAVTFAGAGASVQLTAAADIQASVAGFGLGNTLDLLTIAYNPDAVPSAYTPNGSAGTLALSDGVHQASLAFQGSYAPGNFHVGSDNHGGTAITFMA